MSEEYTPTEEQVREAYAVARHDIVPVRMEDRDSAFNRWLDGHDREVAAKALRSAALMIPGGDTDECRWWLQSRADHIEAGRALADAGLPARKLPTRDEIGEAIRGEIDRYLWDENAPGPDGDIERAAEAVLELLKGEGRD